MSRAQQWQSKYTSADQIKDEEIPQIYDFRNLNGHDLTQGVVRNQVHCGACHAISFIQVVETRLRLKYGDKSVPNLSPQMLLSCNYLNEGCEGGWSIFNGYLAQNGHLVDEKCAPYKATTKKQQCGKFASCKPIAKVTRSYFI